VIELSQSRSIQPPSKAFNLSSTSAYATQRSSSSLPAPASVHPPSRSPTSSHNSATGRSRLRGLTPSTYGPKVATKLSGIRRTIRCSSLFVSRMSTPRKRSLSPSTFPPHSSDSPETSGTGHCRSSSNHARHSTSRSSRGTLSSREPRQLSTCEKTTLSSSRGYRCSTGCTTTSTSALATKRPNGHSHEFQQPK
jgi:hypothetical protein